MKELTVEGKGGINDIPQDKREREKEREREREREREIERERRERSERERQTDRQRTQKGCRTLIKKSEKNVKQTGELTLILVKNKESRWNERHLELAKNKNLKKYTVYQGQTHKNKEGCPKRHAPTEVAVVHGPSKLGVTNHQENVFSES